MHKAQLIVQVLRARDEWEPLINHVGLSRVGIGGVSGYWSVKNIVAHVMCREQHLADRLHEIARGEPELVCTSSEDLEAFIEEFGFPDFASPLLAEDSANEWVFNKYKNIAMNEMIADEIHAFDCLLDGMRQVSEEKLNDLGLV